MKTDRNCSFGFDKNFLYGINSTENKERRDLQKSLEMQRYYQKAKKILIDNREFLDITIQKTKQAKYLFKMFKEFKRAKR